jgi:hypothetical protein
MSRFCDAIRHNPDPILGYLKESPCYLKTILSTATPHGQGPLAEQGHEGRVARQDPDQAVVRRRDHRIGGAVEDGLLGRYDRDVHQELAIFFAAATTSSMPPAM